ncbi:MAG: hypothetical protein H7Y09_08940, partial [Chitinophagaceae bacterium]|nr:hypothetical protein [Anaerolineae bacterium]
MVARLDTERLRTILNAFYGPTQERALTPWLRFRDAAQTVQSVFARKQI